MKRALRDLWPFIILLGITLVFFYKLVFLGSIPFPGDLLLSEYAPWRQSSYNGYVAGAVPSKVQYFDVVRELYPWKTLVIQQIKQGHLPLWNPYNFSGSPLLANYQSAVFYPLHILYLVLPQSAAWAMLILLQPLLGSVFLYLFCRQLGQTRWASILTSMLFHFSSFMNVWMEFGSVGHTLLWLPLLLWISESSAKQKRLSLGKQILLVFGLFCAMTAGHPQDFLTSFLFFGAYTILRISQMTTLEHKQKLAILTRIGTSVLYVFPLAAVQLLPTIELFKNSARVPHDYKFIVGNLLIQPYQLIMVFIQDFFGNPATHSYMLTSTYVNRTLSIGVVGSLLTLFYLFSVKRSWHKTFFLWTGIVILLLTVQNPLSALWYHIPIPILSTATPTRMLYLLTLSLSVMAGFGYDTLEKQTKIRPVAFCAAIILALCWVFIFFGPHISLIPFSTQNYITIKHAVLIATILTLVVMGIILALRIQPKLKIVLVFLVIAELGYGFIKFNPFVPATFIFPDNTVLTYLKNHAGINRFWGYGTARIESNFASQYHLFSPDGTDPLNIRQYNELIQATNNGRIGATFTHENRSDAIIAPGYGQQEMIGNTARLRILNLLGVKYILDRIENNSTAETFPPTQFHPIWKDNGWIIFENKQAAPRYFLTDKVQTYTSTEDFQSKFFAPDFSVSDMVLLLDKDKLPQLSADKNKKLTILSYEPTTVKIQTTAATPQLLFGSDAYAPGWTATVDDIRTPLYQANFAFRAVFVPAGDHVVTFSYKPKSIQIGLALSIVTLLFGIIWIIVKTLTKPTSASL